MTTAVPWMGGDLGTLSNSLTIFTEDDGVLLTEDGQPLLIE